MTLDGIDLVLAILWAGALIRYVCWGVDPRDDWRRLTGRGRANQ